MDMYEYMGSVLRFVGYAIPPGFGFRITPTGREWIVFLMYDDSPVETLYVHDVEYTEGSAVRSAIYMLSSAVKFSEKVGVEQ